MKTTILLCVLIVALNSCDKADNPENPIKNNAPLPPEFTPIMTHPNATPFSVDTLDPKVSFDKNDLINKKWHFYLFYNLRSMMASGWGARLCELNGGHFTLTFYDSDSVAGVYDNVYYGGGHNVYFGEYDVTENGGIAVSKWNGTTSESQWLEDSFNERFPPVRNFYTKDSVLMIFSDEYKIHLIIPKCVNQTE